MEVKLLIEMLNHVLAVGSIGENDEIFVQAHDGRAMKVTGLGLVQNIDDKHLGSNVSLIFAKRLDIQGKIEENSDKTIFLS